MTTTAKLWPIAWNRSIRYKLSLMVGLLIAGISGFIYVYFPSRLEAQATSYFIDKAQGIAEMTAYSASSALLFEDREGMAEVFRGASQNRELVYMVIFDQTGSEFATFAAAGTVPARPPAGSTDRPPDGALYRTVTPVIHQGQRIGRLEAGFSMADLHAQVSRSRAAVALVSLVVFLISSAAVFGISTVVARPLRQMVEAAEQIEKGDLSRRATVFARDEVGQLAQAFNAMVERIEERTAALQREISERSRAEQALRESEQRFRALVEQAADGIFLVRRDGSFQDVNEEACHSLGYTRQELLALPVRDIVAESPWRAFEDLWQGPGPGVPMTIEASHRRKDGTTFPVEVRLGLIESGRAEYVLALARDISDRKEAEEAKRRAEEELETQRSLSMRGDRLRSLGEMAAGIAHELNQPLASVRGLAEHVLIGMDQGWDMWPDKVRDRLTGIVDQADRMTHIIEHVRMFAREADAPTLEPVQVNEVVKSAVDMLAAQFRSRGLAVDCDLAEGLPPVEANAYSLEEVILNLMSNGRDAMEETHRYSGRSKPRLCLTTRLVEEGRDGQQVIIEVQDNGVGIREEILDKVFDPFFTTKDPDRGTGLGLAISKSIVEEVGGRLLIQSSHGHGTTLTISLPPATISDSPPASQG